MKVRKDVISKDEKKQLTHKLHIKVEGKRWNLLECCDYLLHLPERSKSSQSTNIYKHLLIINPFKTMSMMASSSTKDTIPFFKWLDAHFVKVA